MDKTNEICEEFLALIDKFPADEKTLEKRKHQLDKYMLEFVEEVTELIAEGDATHIY